MKTSNSQQPEGMLDRAFILSQVTLTTVLGTSYTDSLRSVYYKPTTLCPLCNSVMLYYVTSLSYVSQHTAIVCLYNVPQTLANHHVACPINRAVLYCTCQQVVEESCTRNFHTTYVIPLYTISLMRNWRKLYAKRKLICTTTTTTASQIVLFSIDIEE